MFSISTFDQANNSLDLNNKITQMFDGEDDDKEHPLQMYHVDSKYLTTEDLTDILPWTRDRPRSIQVIASRGILDVIGTLK